MRPVVHLVFKLRCLTTDHVARMGRNVLLFSILFPSPWCCIQALLSSNLTLSPICSHSIPNPLRQPEEILPIERTIHAGHNSRGGPLCARIYSQEAVLIVSAVVVVTILGPGGQGGATGSTKIKVSIRRCHTNTTRLG